jgi:hypothetical protein
MQNRHPADRLADVRSEIKRLEVEEEGLRAYLLEHPSDRTGEERVGVVGSQSRKRVDLKALADEIGASVGPTIKPAPAVKSERPGTPNNIGDCARNVQRAGGAVPKNSRSPSSRRVLRPPPLTWSIFGSRANF